MNNTGHISSRNSGILNFLFFAAMEEKFRDGKRFQSDWDPQEPRSQNIK